MENFGQDLNHIFEETPVEQRKSAPRLKGVDLYDALQSNVRCHFKDGTELSFYTHWHPAVIVYHLRKSRSRRLVYINTGEDIENSADYVMLRPCDISYLEVESVLSKNSGQENTTTLGF